ncbi:hypothetical protein E2C01_092301 [Portunus trituberculatus]|uniref:Uncharacterized protein n=1 Tax=Portunus trituberculatus TaxID=210409 RepID=A0A5B7JRD2_PORTR|nr:hypothetical protein [Portunus trituberculatus]
MYMVGKEQLKRAVVGVKEVMVTKAWRREMMQGLASLWPSLGHSPLSSLPHITYSCALPGVEENFVNA